MNSRVLIVAVACAMTAAPAALADLTIDLGGGWEATIFDEDNVDLAVIGVEDDLLILKKFANFNKIDPFTGGPQPVHIAFNQIADDAMTVSRIVITEEEIFNNTGIDWTSYRNILLGGNVAWNQAESADFSIDPFTMREYNDDNGIVTFSGGVVPDGAMWSPGVDAGGLQIDIDLSGEQAVKFVLKESPLPAPGVLALFGVAGLAGRRRRRA